MKFTRRTNALPLLLVIFTGGCAIERQAYDRQIASMLREIDAKRIEANVRTLAAFGTRHTLSETESDTHGIGAARRWIKSQLDQYAQASDGRLRVEFQETRVEKTSERIPRPVTVVNVLA